MRADVLQAIPSQGGIEELRSNTEVTLRRCFSDIPFNRSETDLSVTSTSYCSSVSPEENEYFESSSVCSVDSSIINNELFSLEREEEPEDKEEEEAYFFVRTPVKELKPCKSSLSRIFKGSPCNVNLDTNSRSRNSSSASSVSSSKHFDFRNCLHCSQVYASVGGDIENFSLEGQKWKYCSGECHITHLSSAINRERIAARG